MPSAKEIRTGFIEFFKDKNHKYIPSSPIVPADDQSLLFANAGMNQFKDIFLGIRSPDHPRAVNSQKCLRVSGKHNDLEQVGKDTYHHTFFEMLGNWSFNDYFKAETIQWAWELLTRVWEINPDSLWATVFEGNPKDGIPPDEQTEQLWPKVTPIPPERVLRFGTKDNFWEMGETGPCGPCSEIHIDLGPERCSKKNDPNHKCGVNADCGRFIELWNLVFIQYNRTPEGQLQKLDSRYVDTGAGLERIVAVLQNKASNYDTDLFMPIIDATGEITGHKYTGKTNNPKDNAFRVISDHIRALTSAIADGGIPSNEGRGYVIRRILRRAARFGRQLDIHEPFLYKLVPVVVDCLGETFTEIKERADFVATVIESEEKSFGKTLDRGIEIFDWAAEKAAKAPEKTITGEDAFQLYDTYGFPPDLTRLMAEERGLKINKEKFDQLMEEQRQRARAAQKSTSITADISNTELPKTEDLHKYHLSRCAAKIIGLVDESGFKEQGQIQKDAELGIVLDKTCFYAEAGGQVGDTGSIKSETGTFIVQNTTQIAECIIHKGKLAEGKLAVGENVTATVSEDRNATRKNHTATHLLQWALQQTLGKSVSQQGSLVGPDYLRFDFTWPKALSDEQIKEVEKLVREKIAQDEPVTTAVLPREKAEKIGAMALFGEKYGEKVRVVAIGAHNENELQDAFSKEFCGGTHVYRIGVIGGFKIIKEESISAGVRRITALTGPALNRYLDDLSSTLDKLSNILKVPQNDIPQRVEQLIQQNKKLSKQLKSSAKKGSSRTMEEAGEMLKNRQKIGNSSIITGKLSPTTVNQAREAIDMLRKKAQSAAIVLGFENNSKALLLAGVTNDLIEKNIKAGDIVSEIAPIVNGGGGGKANMAQAGGKNPENIEQALQKAAELIKQKLT